MEEENRTNETQEAVVETANKSVVDLDTTLAPEDETATDYQNYIRDCIKAGKVL